MFESVPSFRRRLGDDSAIERHESGTVRSSFIIKRKTEECRLQNAAYRPKLKYYSVLVSTIECNEDKFLFDHGIRRLT